MTFSVRGARATPETGGALLAVLWLSAALAAIAFSVATNVRGETERTSTQLDALRAHYLAAASIDRGLLHIQWGGKYFTAPMPVMRFDYPSGEATLEIIPESAKMSINRATPQDLAGVIVAIGASPDLAASITQAIVQWRQGGGPAELEGQFFGRKTSFPARHASFEEIEELLLLPGMTPDLFHGHYEHDNQGGLIPVAGLKDCLSVYGAVGGFDVNTSSPALMRGLGISPGAVANIVRLRRLQPIKDMGKIAGFNDGSPGFGRLGITASPLCVLRATARLKTPNGQWSNVRQSVSAMVRFLGLEYNPPFHIMRWSDSAYSPE